MIDYHITQETDSAIKSKKSFTLRIKMPYDIIERVITPIGISEEEDIVLYSHVKKTYIGAAADGIQSWTICETKEMPTVSTIGGNIQSLITILEKSGYRLRPKK